MAKLTILILALMAVVLATITTADHDTGIITCGSALKFVHKSTGYHLQTSNVQWGSGSAEQVATALPPQQTNPNTLWGIQTAFEPQQPEKQCPYGQPIKCGDVIRLKHSATNAFLRSQNHRAPISGRQEVSAENKGDKTNENFTVHCLHVPVGTPLYQDTEIKLKHRSGKWLYGRQSENFHQQNCPNCPIMGHIEISTHSSDDKDSIFTMQDGFYIPVNTDRVLYDYNDFGPEPKILFNSKTQNDLPVKKSPLHGHDEL